jgi:signal transduction histidine kinase
MGRTPSALATCPDGARRLARASLLLALGAALVVSHAADAARPGGPSWPSFTLSACWGLLLLRAALALRRRERSRREALERLARSERLRAEGEAQRERAERLATMGRLAADVAHEVRNPLAAVKANLALLRSELWSTACPGRLSPLLDDADQGVARVERIVKDLLAFARPDRDERGTCKVSEVVAEAIQLASLRTRTRLRVENRVPDDAPAVMVGHARMVQVLVHLLVDAAEALEDSPRRGGAPRVVLRAAVARGALQLHVEDDGPGIVAEQAGGLFERRPAGEGPHGVRAPGLAVSRELMARSGGTLTAEHLPDRGARFTATCPLAPAAAAPLPPSRPAEAGPRALA